LGLAAVFILYGNQKSSKKPFPSGSDSIGPMTPRLEQTEKPEQTELASLQSR